VCAFIAAMVRFNWFVCNSRRVKALRLQLSSAQKCLGVRDPHDPGTRRALRAIEQRALPMDIKEDLLHKIVRLSDIAENPATNASDATSVAAEEQCESIPVARADSGEQGFVGNIYLPRKQCPGWNADVIR
jgi:hypothetical protein